MLNNYFCAGSPHPDPSDSILYSWEETARLMSQEVFHSRDGVMLGSRHGIVTVQQENDDGHLSGIFSQFANGRRL